MIDAQEYKRRYYYYKSRGICVKCNKKPALSGIVKCMECNNKSKKIQCAFRSRKHLRNVDALIDKGYITTNESAVILKVSSQHVRILRNKGFLQAKAYAPLTRAKTYWYSETDVLALANQRRRHAKPQRSRNDKGMYAKEEFPFLTGKPIKNNSSN